MKSKFSTITSNVVKNINAPKIVCNHLIGKEHTHRHRMVVGAIIMAVGVFISKAFGFIDLFVVHIISDLLGYLVHGIGAIPYVEYLIEAVKSSD